MSKRIIPLLLALLLTLSLSLPAFAAEASDTGSGIRSDFRDFVATLNPGDGINDAISEVANHTVFGGGKDLALDETSAFTGLLFSANLYEDGLVDALTTAIETLQATGATTLTATGSHTWSQANNSYRYATKNTTLASNSNYTGPLNPCDEAMTTVGLTADSAFTVTQVSADPKSAAYAVSVQVSGIFDIKTVDGSLIPDPQIQEILKWVKAMQAIGLGCVPFRWVVTSDFTVTVPVTCAHTFGPWESLDKLTHAHTCSVCGEKTTAPHNWNEGVPSGDGTSFTFTCADCGTTKTGYTHIVGTWETDFTIPAADFGVEAQDIVLRCTLTFTQDGSVTAHWTPVDLTAIRLYFHQMFVNAYYATAYGAGYTTLEAIEAYCLQNTGMGVVDYINTFLDGYDMEAIFTPAASAGNYKFENSRLLWDLPLMGLASGPMVANPCAIQDDTMTITPISHSRPKHPMSCIRVADSQQ